MGAVKEKFFQSFNKLASLAQNHPGEIAEFVC